MGAPKRIRKKFKRPSGMWNKERIESEHKIRDNYGLKNLHELWKATSEIRRIRRNVRAVLSGKVGEATGNELISRLIKYGVVKEGATLDDLLVIRPENLLERRLQSVVLRKGMAKTLKQSRQLIAHGFIAVQGKRSKSPGYLVTTREEDLISYYKPININQEVQTQPPGTAQPASGAGQAEKKPEEGKAS